MPNGLILILHSGFTKVNVSDCLKALPEEWIKLDRETIEVTYSNKVELSKLYDLDFGQCALEHRRQFTDQIAPILEKKSNYIVVYFGLVPIALAIDFGQLFHNFRNLEIFQLHHVEKKWYQSLDNGSTQNNPIITKGIPDKDQKGITSALIRLGASHFVAPEQTNPVISNAAEVDIHFEKPNEDAITSKQLLVEMAEAVKSAIDALSNNRSGLVEIHLFASIPCGLAFLIGSKISPNIHPYIETYQYSRTADPNYKRALRIKADIQLQRKISVEDKALASELRKLANDELTGKVRSYCEENKSMSKGRSWFLGAVPDLEDDVMNSIFWKDLPALYETSLPNDTFSTELDTIQDGFFWKMNKWYVDDNFFISLNNRFTDQQQIKQAYRLFLFHEALHYKRHNLTDATATNIGSFPKLLETADYQADVYAIMNEFGYHIKMLGRIEDQKSFFLRLIETATETMWSFDDAGVPLSQIQIRRLNRYLIWYWQHARIERNGDSLSEIGRILADKPVIEFNGLKSNEEDNRFYYLLNEVPISHLELGAFYSNRVIRKGSASNMLLENLVDGTREMNGTKVLNVIRSFLEA